MCFFIARQTKKGIKANDSQSKCESQVHLNRIRYVLISIGLKLISLIFWVPGGECIKDNDESVRLSTINLLKSFCTNIFPWVVEQNSPVPLLENRQSNPFLWRIKAASLECPLPTFDCIVLRLTRWMSQGKDDCNGENSPCRSRVGEENLFVIGKTGWFMKEEVMWLRREG